MLHAVPAAYSRRIYDSHSPWAIHRRRKPTTVRCRATMASDLLVTPCRTRPRLDERACIRPRLRRRASAHRHYFLEICTVLQLHCAGVVESECCQLCNWACIRSLVSSALANVVRSREAISISYGYILSFIHRWISNQVGFNIIQLWQTRRELFLTICVPKTLNLIVRRVDRVVQHRVNTCTGLLT